MKVALIIIGNEVLSGETTDTNSAFIGQKIEEAGFQVCLKIGIPDDKEAILDALDLAFERSELVLMTGGLGPTGDDITRQTLCDYFQTKLVFNEEIFGHIQVMLKHRNRPLNQLNRDQALMPETAQILPNNLGSAPGLLFEKDGKILIAMPGVPYEMKEIMQKHVIPLLLRNQYEFVVLNKNFRTVGVPESVIAEKIGEIESSLPENIRLAYLPNLGEVKLRLTARGKNKIVLSVQLDEIQNKIKNLLGDYIYGYDDESLPAALGRLLQHKGKTLVVAESCTGGYISHQITTVSGSSGWFKGGIIAYSNEVKTDMLNISRDLIDHYGAVSEEVVKAMAYGALKALNADYSMAVSGIAGPTGGTSEKPVGTVWMAAVSGKNCHTRHYIFDRSRLQNIQFASTNALNLLRYLILEGN